MKHLRWLLVTATLFALTLVLMGWSDFRELAHQRVWDAVNVDAAEAELAGVRVSVRDTQMAVVKNKPGRGLLYVRIVLQGTTSDISSWMNCRVSLQGPDGQMWMPLTGFDVRGVIKILAPDNDDHGNCNLGMISGQEPAVFDQIYRIPTTDLNKLRLHVSGYKTRPDALSFALKPEVHIF